MEKVQSEKNFVLVPLANGRGFAKVSPEDLDKVKDYKWSFCNGYALTTIYIPYKKTIRMHRLIIDSPNGVYVDHINRDTLDNRRSNLRLATPSQSRANTSGQRTRHISKYKGVRYYSRTKRWVSSICANRKRIFLGSYDLQEDAARAYDSAALYFFGEYAYTNFSDSIPEAPESIHARVKPRMRGFSVYFEKKPNKWIARIKRKGFDKFLGSFETKEEALRAGEGGLEIYRAEIDRCKGLIIEKANNNPPSPVLSQTQPLFIVDAGERKYSNLLNCSALQIPDCKVNKDVDTSEDKNDMGWRCTSDSL
ncbi:MAG: AP2 domain-containing protein [Candidatus Methanoperedens sp.]|nr:AP2 domain-containing protein [Candidatus Methanoperedens sp.]